MELSPASTNSVRRSHLQSRNDTERHKNCIVVSRNDIPVQNSRMYLSLPLIFPLSSSSSRRASGNSENSNLGQPVSPDIRFRHATSNLGTPRKEDTRGGFPAPEAVCERPCIQQGTSPSSPQGVQEQDLPCLNSTNDPRAQ